MKKNILEEINRMKFYFDYKPGKVISEQKNTWLIKEQVTDWTDGGSKTFENADIIKIIQYIKEVDAENNFSKSPVYLAMLKWFEQNDSSETRQSLKNWLGNELTSGIGQSPETTLNKVVDASTLSGFDKTKKLSNNQTTSSTEQTNIKQKQALDLLTKVKTKLSTIVNQGLYVEMKKQVDRLLTELTAFNSKNVIMSTQTSDEIINLMNHILGAFGSDVQYSVDYESPTYGSLTGNEINGYLKGVDLRSSAESDSRVVLSKKQVEPYKESIIATLTTEAGKQLQNKAFLDGFFRGINPTLSDMIIKAKDIVIESADVSVLSKYKEEKKKDDETGVELITTTYSWPPENMNVEQRDEISRNFFEDDDVTLTDETKTELQKKVNEAVAEYKKIMADSGNKAVPKGLYLNFYSSTSKVRTAYSDKKGEYSETNNVPLSLDRIATMKEYLNEIIDNSELNVFEKITVLDLSDPNRGPGWNNTESTFLDGTPMDFKTAYANAPLYLKARTRNPNLTPRQFYGVRDGNAVRNASKLAGVQIGGVALTEEYENLYSEFRYATCGFNMSIEAPKGVSKEEKELEFVVSTSGGLGVMITWTSINWDININIGDGPNKRKSARHIAFVRLKRAVTRNKAVIPKRKTNCPIW